MKVALSRLSSGSKGILPQSRTAQRFARHATDDWDLERVIGLKNVLEDVVMVQAPDRQLNLELVKFHKPVDPEGIRFASANLLGLGHIAFIAEDIESIVDTLKQKGIELVGEIQTFEDSFKLYYVRGL